MSESYCYHGYMITIVAGAFHCNAIVARPDGSSITIPADDERAARKAAQYEIRRRERGQEERDA